jgi:hypothetical protein
MLRSFVLCCQLGQGTSFHQTPSAAVVPSDSVRQRPQVAQGNRSLLKVILQIWESVSSWSDHAVAHLLPVVYLDTGAPAVLIERAQSVPQCCVIECYSCSAAKPRLRRFTPLRVSPPAVLHATLQRRSPSSTPKRSRTKIRAFG